MKNQPLPSATAIMILAELLLGFGTLAIHKGATAQESERSSISGNECPSSLLEVPESSELGFYGITVPENAQIEMDNGQLPAIIWPNLETPDRWTLARLAQHPSIVTAGKITVRSLRQYEEIKDREKIQTQQRLDLWSMINQREAPIRKLSSQPNETYAFMQLPDGSISLMRQIYISGNKFENIAIAVHRIIGNMVVEARFFLNATRCPNAPDTVTAILKGMGKLRLSEPQVDSASASLANKEEVSIIIALGIDLGKTGQYMEAIDSFNRAIKINPNNDKAWYNRGLTFSKLGDHQEAVASYNRAIRINPNLDSAWLNRGIALDKLGRFNEAVASYNRAIQIDSSKSTVWYNRGLTLSEMGRYREALFSYDTAIKIKPGFREALEARDFLLQKLSR